MTITVPSIPTPVPTSTDPTNFDERADALLAALPGVVTAQNQQNVENNTISGNVNTKATATAADAVATAADRVQTGLDRTAAASSKTGTAADAVATAADRVQTGLDRTAAASSKTGTAADAVATAADRVQTGLDRTAAASSASAANGSANTAATEADAAAASAASIAGGPVASIAGLTGAVTAAAARTALSISTRTLFSKADTQSVAFTKTAAGTAQLKAGTYIDVSGTLLTFASATAIVMPTLTAGTDYAIYACTDGTVRADASFSAPSGYTSTTSRKIGGFHYAPGGNASARAGGDTTPAINEYSLWDLKFKPSSPDPRGMVLVADGFWADIYLLGVDHLTNGTSKYNVTIADGSSPPKIPTKFGGNGTTAYGSLNWWEAAEVLRSHGKRPPTYDEFAALAFGTTEATSGGTDPGSTILRAAYTSKWGAMLASGNMWQWGAEFGGGAAGAAWTANTGGRGSTYQMENAAIFGGNWVDTSNSGSRCSSWFFSPTNSIYDIGSRGVCDLLVLE